MHEDILLTYDAPHNFLAFLFFYSLGSQRLERTVLTAPILFTAAGMLVHIVSLELLARAGSLELFLRIAEIGLVLLLFTDACRTDLRALKDIRNLPARRLNAGMLLTILLGAIDHCVGNVSARRHIGRYPGHQNAIPTCASRYFLRKCVPKRFNCYRCVTKFPITK